MTGRPDFLLGRPLRLDGSTGSERQSWFQRRSESGALVGFLAPLSVTWSPMVIETRIVGRKSRPLDRWAVPTPPPAQDTGGGLTLRELITRVVRSEVVAFDRREQVRQLLRVLSKSEIVEGAARGKVDLGGHEPTGPADPEAAVGAALQGFEDGLYLVILDGVEQRELDRQVYLTAESTLVFLRLTFLAGA
jgi:hypothetical protein